MNPAELAERARARRTEIAEQRASNAEDVNEKLGLPDDRRIVEFVQRGTGRDAEFDIRLVDGTLIEVGSASTLLHPQRFEACFAVAGITWDDGFNRKEQKRIAAALLAIREVVGGDEREQTREWIAEWVATEGIGSGDGIPFVDLADAREKFEAIYRDERFFRGSDERVYLRRPPFVKFLSKSLGERVSSIALGKRLERLGFERAGTNAEGKLGARYGDETISRAYFVSPPGWRADG